MFFRSERLFLRPIWADDWSAILAGIADEAVVHNLSRVPWPYGEAEARAFAALPEDPRFPRCLITRPSATGVEVLGVISLVPVGEEVQLGYWLARPYWGQGYATEAARAMLAMARGLGHKQLTATHFIDNPASGRVLAKLGFEPTGELRTQASSVRQEPAAAAVLALNLESAGGMPGGDDGSGGDAPGLELAAA
jgi:RimJ/RimL family protein N-acetyltransferase